jgi:hypothetical protein
MDSREKLLLALFTRLKDELRDEFGVRLSLVAEGWKNALRVSNRKGTDERPHFEIIVTERENGFKITYRPHGKPTEAGRTVPPEPRSLDALLGIVRELIQNERRRLIEYGQGEKRRDRDRDF